MTPEQRAALDTLIARAKKMQEAIDGEWGSVRDWEQIAAEEAGDPDVDAILAMEALL